MQWYTEDIEGMEGEEVFTKGGRTVDVIAGVIRLRGGITRIPGTNATILPSTTRSGKRFRSESSFDLYVGQEGMRMKSHRTVYIQEGPDQSAAMCPVDIVRQIKTKNMLYTAYSYNMNPVMWTAVEGADASYVGIGPALYWTTEETLTVSSKPNIKLGTLREYVDPYNMGQQQNPHCPNGIIYVFAADWFGAEMQSDTRYQLSNAVDITHLGWAPAATEVTTDPNTPITYADLSSNKDWSRIRHYVTFITFDFTNLAPYPYVVEILFFKFMVDPNDLTYQEMCIAPMAMQTKQIQAYCEGSIQQFGTPQIKVIRRKRIKIFGLDQNMPVSKSSNEAMEYACTQNLFHANNARYKFKIYRQYDCVRGIHSQAISLTETSFFNRFYDVNNGIYCRVQAWPEHPMWTSKFLDSTTLTPYTQLNNTYDSACVANPARNLTAVKPALQCIMEKRSFIKVDAPILKGPLRQD